MEADIVIKNGLVLTMDDKMTVHEQADVVISGRKIFEVVPKTKFKGKKELDARGMIVMPGLINTHTHAAMVMMRGLADDMPFEMWWNKYIFPIENKLLNPEFIKTGVSLAAVEMIKSGTTTFVDMYYFEQAAAESCKEIGLRCFLGEVILDFKDPDSPSAEESLELIKKLHETWKNDSLINLMVDPHALYSCNKEHLMMARELATQLGLPLQVHVAETATEVAEFKKKTGMSEISFLAQIGFLGKDVIAVHCVHIDHDDFKLLKQYDVKVAHCQESNMKLGAGTAPIVEMMDEGIVVGLGTDSAVSNNNLDLFDEMDSVAKHHKAIRNDPTVMPAPTVLRMATIDAARVLGREKELGSLEAGKIADIILVDAERPNMVPLYNPYSQIVYSAGGSEVSSVIIDGRLVMEKGKILTVNEKEVINKAQKLAEKIRKELKNA